MKKPLKVSGGSLSTAEQRKGKSWAVTDLTEPLGQALPEAHTAAPLAEKCPPRRHPRPNS